MALDYDNRTDFRAFDVLISAIDNASKADIQKAIKTCEEIYRSDSWPDSVRPVWRDMATLLRRQAKRF